MYMSFFEYQTNATNTFKEPRVLSLQESQRVNWALGVANEAGELAGEVKHIIFHGEELDKMKLAKEIGDVLWYLSALCESLEIELGNCAELNIAKLRHRHGGEGYSKEGSAERRAREQKFEDTEQYLRLKKLIEGSE